VFALLCLTFVAPPAEPPVDALRLKARAALALAFAAPPKPPTYAELYAAAVRDRVPLVVWVGQPAAALPGVRSIRLEAFAGVTGPAVVVGLPNGPGLRRLDLPGTRTATEVRAAVAGWVR
jgi:hypothetical protein